MANSQSIVKQETSYVAAWVAAGGMLTQGVCLVSGLWNLPVLLGSVLGGITAVGNFLLMCRMITKAVTQTEKQAKNTVKLSQGLRLMMQGLVLVLAVYMFPLMARYQNTLHQLATNALILAVVKLPRTVGLFLLSCMPLLILALSLETFLNTMVFWLAIGFGFTAYMSASLLKPVFAELETGNVQVMK